MLECLDTNLGRPALKRVVLFDFHNTLATCDGWLDLEIRTLPALVLRRLNREGLVASLPGDSEEQATALFRRLRQDVHTSGREVSAAEGTAGVLRELGIDASMEDIERAVQALEYQLLPSVEMVEGVDHALERLRNAGCRLGVVSSAGFPPFVELALEKLGLRAYFGEVITTAGAGIYKSDPEIFRMAAHLLGAIPAEAAHVGDHPRFDVAAAGAAGLSTVWFIPHAWRTAQVRGESWNDFLAAASPDAVVESMADLYDAIAGLG
jgi:HAD superfamily hydrolase (TIGR01509 family)